MGWVLYVNAIISMITGSAQQAASYVESLPPKPTQSSIACHDKAWESQNLQEIQGFTAHKKLAPFVEKAIKDAADQGVYLGITAAYRSCDTQIQLRRINCGLGDFNIYQKPSNQCKPPTEPPGSSLHNEGLAVDFNCRGYGTIESSPCLPWLDKNGYRYHLKKHDIEAWHWSTTGL